MVGLKYLDVGSLTVKRWGSVEDVKSSVKVFRKKDILVEEDTLEVKIHNLRNEHP